VSIDKYDTKNIRPQSQIDTNNKRLVDRNQKHSNFQVLCFFLEMKEYVWFTK